MVDTQDSTTCNVDGLQIKYIRSCLAKDPKHTILFLNGWGGSSLSWRNNIKELAKFYDCIALDFPGFGVSDEPNEVWDVYKYAVFLEDFRKTLNLKTFVLVGKSFGGRVAIAYAAKYESALESLVLVSAAGLEKKSAKAYILVFFAKILKALSKVLDAETFLKIKGFFYKIFHLKIEQNPYKRSIKSVIVSQDLSKETSQVSVPTLIIWGLNDKILPLKVGCRLAGKIKGSCLEFVADAGHFINENRAEEFNSLVLNFLKDL